MNDLATEVYEKCGLRHIELRLTKILGTVRMIEIIGTGGESLRRRRSGQGKHFVPQGCRVVAGLHSCREALRLRSGDIQEMWFKREMRGDLLALFQRAESLGVRIVIPSLHHMDEFCATHQGVLLFVSSSPELDWSSLKSVDKIQLVAVDGVVDPRNLGAIMRTAWLMGVPAILTSLSRTSPVSGVVMKVACGAGEHVAVERCEGLGEALKSLKEIGFWIYGLASGTSESLWEASCSEKIIWVIGSEERGLRQTIRRVCDKVMSIPQVEDSASYNASVAAALAMGEYGRQNL